MHSRDGAEEEHRSGGGKANRKATPSLGHEVEKSKRGALWFNNNRFLEPFSYSPSVYTHVF
jgi:hypothetical protein